MIVILFFSGSTPHCPHYVRALFRHHHTLLYTYLHHICMWCVWLCYRKKTVNWILWATHAHEKKKFNRHSAQDERATKGAHKRVWLSRQFFFYLIRTRSDRDHLTMVGRDERSHIKIKLHAREYRFFLCVYGVFKFIN